MTFQDIIDQVLGYAKSIGKTPSFHDVKAWANEGYRTALMGGPTAHRWTFLTPTATFTAWPTTTGTLSTAVESGGSTTITATTAVFYPSMIGHDIKFTQNSYTITAYTSSTVVVVSGDAEAETGTFTIIADGVYRLPDDYDGMASGFTYSPSTTSGLVRVAQRPAQWLRECMAGTTATGYPNYFAVEPVALDSTAGQRHNVLFYPIPGAVSVLNYAYSVDPSELSLDAGYIYGGAAFAQLVMMAALAIAEKRLTQTIGVNAVEYKEALVGAIARDVSKRPRYAGSLAQEAIPFERRTNVTYITD